MRNLSFAVLAFLCGSSTAFAQNLNLISETCDHASKLESTGFVLSWNKQVYVLASADFVYSGSQPRFCHQVIDSKGSSHSLELSRYDWSMGLALLKGDDSLAPFTTPLNPVAPKILMTASWESGSGQIVSVHSQRHHFAAMDETLELKATDTDFHSVGSAIANDKKQIIGFISDQIIEEVPGHSSRVARWLDHLGEKSRHLIVIPAMSISRWLEGALQPGWTPPFNVDPQTQLDRKYQFIAGSIAFTEDCPASNVDPGDDSADPIGGGSGGGDGVGIGGDSSRLSCTFHVSKTETLGAMDSLPAIRKPWLSQLESYLKNSVKTSVRAAHYRDVNYLLRSQGMVSIGNLGQLLLRPELGFLLQLEGKNAPHEPKLERMREAGRCLRDGLKPNQGFSMSVIQLAYLYGSLSLTDDWKTVGISDVYSLIGLIDEERMKNSGPAHDKELNTYLRCSEDFLDARAEAGK